MNCHVPEHGVFLSTSNECAVTSSSLTSVEGGNRSLKEVTQWPGDCGGHGKGTLPLCSQPLPPQLDHWPPGRHRQHCIHSSAVAASS